jgi:hypothetical protein
MHLIARSLTLGRFALFALAGCATLTCQPLTVTVADKKEQARFETTPGAMRTTETGRIEEDVGQSRTVREYWVRSSEGQWHRVSAEQYRNAETGRELEVCK